MPARSWLPFPDQADQFEQLFDAKRGASSGDNVERILSHLARPIGRHRAQAVRNVVKPNPILAPVLSTKDQFKFVAEQGMIRMGYPETSALIVANRRN